MRTLIRPALIALLALACAGLWPRATTVEATGVVAISAGGYHTCALVVDGGVSCWGANMAGQLGTGDTCCGIPYGYSSVPRRVVGLGEDALSVSAGLEHTCALLSGGAVKCWGGRNSQITGCGSGCGNRAFPQDVAGLASGIVAVSAGGLHTCVLTAAGGVKCWGYNQYGQAGDGNSTGFTSDYRPTPVDVVGLTSGVVGIAAGFWHTCALTVNSEVKCWGRNDDGQLGNGAGGEILWSATPVDVCGDATCTAPLAGITALAAGGEVIPTGHTCAITAKSAVLCWGSGQPCGSGPNQFTPQTVWLDSACTLPLLGAVGITAGALDTCILTLTSAVICLGVFPPEAISGLPTDVRAVDLGGGHTCVASLGGRSYCWGDNFLGRLGDGTTVNRAQPTEVLVDSDGDYCSDAREVGTSPSLGGLRNPKLFWDFYDVPAPPGLVRDRLVSIADIAAIVARYGATGDQGGDALSPPPSPPAHHTAYDRTSAGPPSWRTGPPNGSITVQDIALVVAQFGHSCA
jgi:alpha-tubulin suppressor-like RCC1 family protein